MATLAAEAQTIIVSAVTQYTNVLTTTIVSATRVHHCRTKQMSDFITFLWVSWGLIKIRDLKYLLLNKRKACTTISDQQIKNSLHYLKSWKHSVVAAEMLELPWPLNWMWLISLLDVCLLTNRLKNGVWDCNVTRSLCSSIQECWVVVTEAVGSQHTHLGPVSEEHMVFKYSNPKRMWSLGSTI